MEHAGVGEARLEVLIGLHAYWSKLIDFAQRQEHGASKEGEALGFEDARLLLHHAIFVLGEIDRALGGAV